jgi:hypothetical protein
MASLNQIVDNIALRLDQPFNTILKDSLKFTVRHYRAEFIRNDMNKNGLSFQYLQSFIANVSKVNVLDDCNDDGENDLDDSCYILRSTNKIPNPIRINGSINFKFVGTSNPSGGLNPFTYTEDHEMDFSSYNKYTGCVPRYFMRNGYMFFKNIKRLKYVRIEHSFENPEDVFNYCSATSGCYTDDMEFPISIDMLRNITNGILSGEFKIVPDDVVVDTNERDFTSIDANQRPLRR